MFYVANNFANMAFGNQKNGLEADLTFVNSKDVQSVLTASRNGDDGAKNAAIAAMVAKYAKTGATADQQAALTEALQDTGTTGKIQMEDLAVIAKAEKAIHPKSSSSPTSGTYIDNIMEASKKGDDNAKNQAIADMVRAYKKKGATDDECAALTAALQGCGDAGRFKLGDLETINKAQEKINGSASVYINGAPSSLTEQRVSGGAAVFSDGNVI